MKITRTLLLLSFLAFPSSAATIRGTVRDGGGRPVEGARVAAADRAVTTNDEGAFAIDVPDATAIVRITKEGFRPAESAGGEVELRPALAETLVVSGIRAEAATPVTKSDIGRERIERSYHGQDIPLLLREVPSIHAYAESGAGGSGYSYITLRGVSPTRINFTLDGVPLADSEDMATYFADFPDLASSLQSIQVQRGVGTSTVGSPSFGGSVNLESLAPAQDQQTLARVSAGSFGHRYASVGHHSGFLPGGLALYSRLSWQESDGFRDHSGIRQRNLFLTATRTGENSQIRLTGFSGHEDQELAFYATDEETLRADLRANPLVPEEKDSFGYDLAQLQYIRAVSDRVNLTASAYYQRGYGWYRLYDDNLARENLRQYGLDGLLLGTMLTASWRSGSLTANGGVHVNRFRREHTRDLVNGPRDYFNEGTKDEANAFAKLYLDRGRWHLYGDAQLRHSDFEYDGDVDIEPISWTFFNPKLGARFDLTAASSVYASAGLSTREPARNDFFAGEDNPTIGHDLHAVRPERLFDLEAGWEMRARSLSIAANLYAMEFRNEIAATGELSEIGLPLRRNVGRSYRRGIELDARWLAGPALTLRGNANFSRNRIAEWTQFYDVYDDGGSYVTSRAVTHRDVEPLLTPKAIVNAAFEYTPSPRIRFGATGRYAGPSYLDNTGDDAFTTPAYFAADANLSVAIGITRLSLQVNNLFDNDRVWPSGYSYRFFAGETRSGVAYYYPQATRHFVVMLDVKM